MKSNTFLPLKIAIFGVSLAMFSILPRQNTYAAGIKESLGSWFTENTQESVTNGEKPKIGKKEGKNTEKKAVELKDLVKNLFSSTCQPVSFTDIKTSIFANDIEQLANLCIVRGTITPGKFYPDNFVRRADAISMLVHAYKSLVLDENDTVERKNFTDIKKGTKLDMLLQVAGKMGIVDLFVTKKATKFVPDAFVTQADIRRVMVHLNAKYPMIKPDGIGILTDDGEYVTRGELAHVIAVSLRQGTTNTIRKEQEKTYPNIQTLIDIGILHPHSYIANHPKDPITRIEFLGLLVKCEQYRNPSIPRNPLSKTQYFADILPTLEQVFMLEATSKVQTGVNERFDDLVMVVNQAKNLGLTSFFETAKRGKLYLEPMKYVTEYEATVVINQVAPNKLPVDENSDNVLISNEKLASLLTMAYGFTSPVSKETPKTYQKATLNELWNRIKNMFTSGKST